MGILAPIGASEMFLTKAGSNRCMNFGCEKYRSKSCMRISSHILIATALIPTANRAISFLRASSGSMSLALSVMRKKISPSAKVIFLLAKPFEYDEPRVDNCRAACRHVVADPLEFLSKLKQ